MENINFLQLQEDMNKELDSTTTCCSTSDAVNAFYKYPIGDYCTCRRCPCCGKLIRDYPTYPWTNPGWYYCSQETTVSLSDGTANVFANNLLN